MCLFFIIKMVIKMKIYLDLIMILNFVFDFLLLLSTSIILRRNISINRIILGAFIGGLSILFLFIKINSIQLFFFKIMISILMIIISFGFKDIRYFCKNLCFFYMASIILGGFLYFLNIQFSYKNNGIVFFNNGLSVNVIFLIIFSPIIIYIYIKQCKSLKNNYANYYRADLYLNSNHVIKLNAFLDTGNKLIDPYQKRPIILVNKKDLIFDIKDYKTILVPYETVNDKGLLKCIKVNKIDIEGVGIKTKFLVGIMDDKISIDGVNCILNYRLLEE